MIPNRSMEIGLHSRLPQGRECDLRACCKPFFHGHLPQFFALSFTPLPCKAVLLLFCFLGLRSTKCGSTQRFQFALLYFALLCQVLSSTSPRADQDDVLVLVGSDNADERFKGTQSMIPQLIFPDVFLRHVHGQGGWRRFLESLMLAEVGEVAGDGSWLYIICTLRQRELNQTRSF